MYEVMIKNLPPIPPAASENRCAEINGVFNSIIVLLLISLGCPENNHKKKTKKIKEKAAKEKQNRT